MSTVRFQKEKKVQKKEKSDAKKIKNDNRYLLIGLLNVSFANKKDHGQDENNQRL